MICRSSTEQGQKSLSRPHPLPMASARGTVEPLCHMAVFIWEGGFSVLLAISVSPPSHHLLLLPWNAQRLLFSGPYSPSGLGRWGILQSFLSEGMSASLPSVPSIRLFHLEKFPLVMKPGAILKASPSSVSSRPCAATEGVPAPDAERLDKDPETCTSQLGWGVWSHVLWWSYICSGSALLKPLLNVEKNKLAASTKAVSFHVGVSSAWNEYSRFNSLILAQLGSNVVRFVYCQGIN